MKLVSFERDGKQSYGVVKGDGVVDLMARFGPRGLATLRQFLAADGIKEIKGAVRDWPSDLPVEGLTFLPVIPEPGKILCVALNYRSHVEETGRTVTERPALFARYPESQVGHLQKLVRPFESTEFDYEGELAVIIGRNCRRATEEEALSYVAGYSCYNEGTIRDWQRHTSQFLAGKTFAKTGSFGPWLVTSDEIPDPSKLTLETRLNGQVVQSAPTNLMMTSVPALIQYCSTIMTLEPGDVILSGTPGGVGSRRQPPLWMKAGDVVEVEISGVGCLKNMVEDERAA